jgi:hypothetical protein
MPFAFLRPAALAAFLAAAPPAFGQAAEPDWSPLFPQTRAITLAWDRAHPVRRGDVVEVVVRATTHIGARSGHVDILTEIRCPDRRARIVRTTNYGPDGAPLVEDRPKAKFFKIKANTYHEIIRAAVC